VTKRKDSRSRITAAHIRRRTREEISELARDAVTNQVFVTNDERAIRSAFYMMLAICNMTEAATKKVGALIGYNDTIVPRMGMNGYPIYAKIGFLHRHDLSAYRAEVARLRKALGFKDDEREGTT